MCKYVCARVFMGDVRFTMSQLKFAFLYAAEGNFVTSYTLTYVQ